MGSLLKVTNLRRTFGSLTAVNGLSFDVHAGEAFGLLGPNGAGKSSTMMMLCGQLPMTSGMVTLDGYDLVDDSYKVRQLLGVIPQDLAIYPDLTAEENLRFFGSLYNLSGDLLSRRVIETLQQVGLTSRRNDAAGTFSGGMKRRLNFAAAVLHKPRLLILDEPTVGVDPHSRTHLMDCIRSLQRQGTAIIYASHYIEEVQALCSRVAIVDHGKILINDSLSNLLAKVPQEIEIVVPAETPPQQLGIPFHTETSVTDAGLSIRLSQKSSSENVLNHQLAQLMTRLSEQQIRLLNIRTHESSLERLFLELTGTRLRD